MLLISTKAGGMTGTHTLCFFEQFSITTFLIQMNFLTNSWQRHTLPLVLTAVTLSALTLTSCQDYDAGFTAADFKKKEYSDNFEKMFGEIDPEQDWSMAQQITAQIFGVEGPCEVSVYTASPISERSAVLYRKAFAANQSIDFKFDAPKSASTVFVEVTDANGMTPISGYFELKDKQLNAKVGGITRSSGSPADLSSATKYTTAKYDVYNLVDQNDRVDGSTVMLSDIDEIVGRGRVFNERGHADATPKYCNLVEYADVLNALEGAEYIMETDGPIEFDLIYGGTTHHNYLGYFYYPDGMSKNEALKQPHYILADARPHYNVKVDGTFPTAGMSLPGLVDGYDANPCASTDKELTGGHYKLTYFGEDGKSGTPSYTFKAGTHVVFFMVQDAGTTIVESSLAAKIENSVPEFNLLEDKLQHEHDGHTNDSEWWNLPTGEGHGEIDAVTYGWGGATILGFEDRDPDQDMNDILLFVKGKFKKTQTEMKVESDVYEWMVACEDLGGTFDYDFNDVVFGVKHYTSKKTLFSEYYLNGVLQTETPKIIDQENYIIMTPYAAGGTLKTNVYYNNGLLGEIHALLRTNMASEYEAKESGSMPVLNADAHTYKGTPVVYVLGNEEEFTMDNTLGSTSTGKFSLKTIPAGSTSATEVGSIIHAPKSGEAPQMLVLPQGWDWPTELTHITSVYPDFKNWTESSEVNGWIANKTGSYVQNPNKLESVNGGGNSNGGGSEPDDDDKITPTITVSNPVINLRKGGETETVTLSIANGDLSNVRIYNSDALIVSFAYDEDTHAITFTSCGSGSQTGGIGTSTITVKTPADETHNEGILKFTVNVLRELPAFTIYEGTGTNVIEDGGTITVTMGQTVFIGCTMTKGNAGTTYASIKDTDIATVTNANAYTGWTITPVAEGTTKFIVKHGQDQFIDDLTKEYTLKVVPASESALPEYPFTIKIGDTTIEDGDIYQVTVGTEITNLTIPLENGFTVHAENPEIAAVLMNNVEQDGNAYGHNIKAKAVGEGVITISHAATSTHKLTTKSFTVKVVEVETTPENPETQDPEDTTPNATPRSNETLTVESNGKLSLDYNTYFKGLTTITLKVTKGNESYQFNYGTLDEYSNLTSLSSSAYAWYDSDQTFTISVSSLNKKNLGIDTFGNLKGATVTITVQ